MDKPFVKVTWHDAADEERIWLKEADVEAFGTESLEVVSWGWLMKKTRQYVTLAADHITGTDTYGRVTKIPTQWAKIEEFKQD